LIKTGDENMEDKVLAAMKKVAKPVKTGEVAEMVGAESKEISKVINKLKKQGKVVSPKRCYYSLAED
jgi:Mn-dependent DtxR family transcriptional regulator